VAALTLFDRRVNWSFRRQASRAAGDLEAYLVQRKDLVKRDESQSFKRRCDIIPEGLSQPRSDRCLLDAETCGTMNCRLCEARSWFDPCAGIVPVQAASPVLLEMEEALRTVGTGCPTLSSQHCSTM
jgi:hypothetical protein